MFFGRKRKGTAASSSLSRRKRAAAARKAARPNRLAFESLEPRLVLDGLPIISEFMAINDNSLETRTRDNDTLPYEGAFLTPDWLEIYNPDNTVVDLTGWQLQDGGNLWEFPAGTTLGPYEYKVVCASGLDITDPNLDENGYLHTNFSLKGNGEYLGLLDDLDVIVHDYDEYPAQEPDISYGIGQQIETTEFVYSGDTASYLVPGSPQGDWTTIGFDDSGWDSGDTGIGFVDTVPGFAVWNYNASSSFGDLYGALSYIDNNQPDFSENAAVIDYYNSGGHGHYVVDEPNFPGFTGPMDNFATKATGFVTIPAAGDYSFGVNSDDGFQFTIIGATVTAAVNYNPTTENPVGTDTIKYVATRGNSDTIGVFNFPAAGAYEIELFHYENGGGASLEVFAATGHYTAFNSGVFDLLGDTANGGLEVNSLPIGGGTGTGFASLVRTDVKDDMKDVNASAFVRIPFTVGDPALYTSLTLKMKYDDGYVAYLNGVEIASRNAPAHTPGNLLPYDSEATADRTDPEAEAWENVDVTANLGDLVAGPNVLAIHAMNDTAANGDFLVLPELLEILALGLGENYFAVATPGEANAEEFWLHVEDTQFSHDRGFYDEPFSLVISTDTAGADIYYTTDGSDPSDASGTLYTNPIPISTTTVLRATAFKAAHAPSNTDTQTYIFLDDVLTQPSNPEGFPSDWNGTVADYEMDPEVVTDPDYADQMIDALTSIPTMSIVTTMDDMFDATTGIYSNPYGEGLAWERPTSVEWINTDGTTGFQVDAGLRIYGGAFRGMGLTRKKTFRLLFKDDYGPTKLDFPMFGTDTGATTSFDTIILRGGANDAWNNWGDADTQYITDEFMRRLQLSLGEPSAHGTFVHLYVNGLYWGLYNPVERPEASFSATYFGGDKTEWDALNSAAPTGDSNTVTWNAMLAQVRAGLADMESYQKIQGNNPDGTNNPAYDDLLDIENYIAYMFSNFWGGTGDWPGHNWYAACRRPPNATGFKSFNWDSEGAIIIWSSLTADRTGVNNSLAEPYAALRANPEFNMQFADQAHRYLFNGGPATPGPSHDRYEELANEIELAIIAESARWGDQRGTLFTPDDWAGKRDYVLDTYMPNRPTNVLNQLKNAGLYPQNAVAPSFKINTVYQHGGSIDIGDELTMDPTGGTIYYTLDGTDPRELGGALSPGALTYSSAITLNEGTHVKSRTLLGGGEWSALNEATFYIDLAPNIRITEIMYNPADPSPAEIAAGYSDNDDFEFIEIKNISATKTLPLSGLRFSDGIDFIFPSIDIVPGEYMVVVKNEAAFNFRYSSFSGTIAGEFVDSSLNNGGEDVGLDSPIGGIIHDFDYNDGWYAHTDGDGFSLTIRDPLGESDPLSELDRWDMKDGWRASAAPGGTPGYDDTLLDPGSIIINEVLAHSDVLVWDAIELHNTSESAVDISGWFLSDQKNDEFGVEVLTKYQIPATTVIAAGGYVVFYEDLHFGTGPTPFSLNELGDDVYLSSNAAGVAGGYREHVDFGASPADIPFGLHIKSTGGTDFTLLTAPTFGPTNEEHENADPYLEELVINEVMYHPSDPTTDEVLAGFNDQDYFEFVEIHNRSGLTKTLSDYYVGNGVGFTFGWYDADSPPVAESWTLEPGATATWNATLPAGLDSYEVFARWDLLDAEGDARDLDGQARYEITHNAGSAVVIRDQKPEEDDEGPGYMDSEGWVSLGTYDFNATGQVVLTRGTNNPGNWTIADQVKFVSTAHTEIVDNPTLDSWYTANGPATIAPGAYVVIVSNRAAFDERYDIAGNGIPVVGQYTGNASNNGEKLKLFRVGNPELSGFIPYYRIDYVNYGDNAPWPLEADGMASAMNRVDAGQYGNDPINWTASQVGGTPGTVNEDIDRTPPSVPTGLTTHTVVNPAHAINVSWDASTDVDSYVDYYVIYRDDKWINTSTTTSYSDTDVDVAESYSYQVSAVNRDGYASARSTALDVTYPGIANYAVADTTHIDITFTEALDPSTAEVLGNYAYTGGSLLGVELLGPDDLTVRLTVTELVIGDPYSVTVNNVTTLSGNEMPPNLQIAFNYSPQGSGEILRESWIGIGGGAISDLIGNANYPDNPNGWDMLTDLEYPQSEGFGDSYGTRIRGYIHPPTSGDYTFWIASDDNSELYLSSDSSPSNAERIALVSGWTGFRAYTNNAEQQSVPITLSAGQKYYIEVLHKEGSGGDHLSVRWQMPGGVWEDPGDESLPIPGIRLSPFVVDHDPPTVDIVDVDPDPRTTSVDQIDIVFNEEISGLDLGDLSLTRDGGANLLPGGASLSTVDNVTWALNGLSGLTSPTGTYLLTLTAAGSGIIDTAGNDLAGDASDTWETVLVGPMVNIVDVVPDPRNSTVDEIQIDFSEYITGFDLGDLALTRDGGANLLPGGASLSTEDNISWMLDGLTSLTAASGLYTLTLTAAGSNIRDVLLNELIGDGTDSWLTDATPPTADVVDVTPDPRDLLVSEIDIVFSEPVTGLDLDDLTLTRDGGGDLLTGTESLDTEDDVTWTLGGLAPLTSAGGGGTGFVAYNDHVTDYGAGTHTNTTAFSAHPNLVDVGLLKDISTGAATNVTLQVTAAGISWESSQAHPAAGTDAYSIFYSCDDEYMPAGYEGISNAVDLSGEGVPGGDASLAISGADHYTYTFSGLNAEDASTYTFHGTAIRGNSDYTNRWTLVTLVGAESATAAHSDGVGIVTHEENPALDEFFQAALWVGHNSASGQGFVAGWTDIDPGPDGEFTIVSQQYKGPTPGVGTGDSSSGSKGYAIGGIRLIETAAAGMPGNYTLNLTASGSGIEDATGNPLLADASDSWVVGPAGVVVDRHLFYNNSRWDGFDPSHGASDDTAIAPDKSALLPGDPTATFANYTSYSRGINGVMIDMRNLADGVNLGLDDFEFCVGNDCNGPAGWAAAPDPLPVEVRRVGDIDRITLIWADDNPWTAAVEPGAIAKQWLQVRVLATEKTGLLQDDVFYFGNAIGDTGDAAINATVNSLDEIAVRNHPVFFPPAAIDDRYDFDRDKIVGAADQIIARGNRTSSDSLKLFAPSSVVATDDISSTAANAALAIAALSNDRDASGAPLSVYQVDTTSTWGASISINGDNTLAYDPSVSATLLGLSPGETRDDTFSYTIRDVSDRIDTGTVTVTVTGVASPPQNPDDAGGGGDSGIVREPLSSPTPDPSGLSGPQQLEVTGDAVKPRAAAWLPLDAMVADESKRPSRITPAQSHQRLTLADAAMIALTSEDDSDETESQSLKTELNPGLLDLLAEEQTGRR